jgi:hypothetical protein
MATVLDSPVFLIRRTFASKDPGFLGLTFSAGPQPRWVSMIGVMSTTLVEISMDGLMAIMLLLIFE